MEPKGYKTPLGVFLNDFSKKEKFKEFGTQATRGRIQVQIIDFFVLFLDQHTTVKVSEANEDTPEGINSCRLSEAGSWRQVMIRKRPRLVYSQAFPHVLANRFGSLCLHIV